MDIEFIVGDKSRREFAYFNNLRFILVNDCWSYLRNRIIFSLYTTLVHYTINMACTK